MEVKKDSSKKLAIVPWGISYDGDKLFDITKTITNRDNAGIVFVEFKTQMEEFGWQVHTIDLYQNLEEIDLVVFFTFDQSWYLKIRDAGLAEKTIYMAWEPSVVDYNHSKRGIHCLLHYFKYILTWDDGLVDKIRIHKFMYPYYFDPVLSSLPFEEKELLVNISNDKTSVWGNELYSERKRVISYFDGKDGFSLYGTNWPTGKFTSYRGRAESKKDVYHRFKFALCLENMRNIEGYITEKILDCFCAGIVPIYLGASNIDKYIPKTCYIPYCQFSSIEHLEAFLRNMTEEQHKQYISAAQDWLESDQAKAFLMKNLSNTIKMLAEKEDIEFKANYDLFHYKKFSCEEKAIRKGRNLFLR